jgi:pimeloyl-ACP methyl ester carboxylesterase
MGFHFGYCARIFVELMNRLGHETFYTQGGDWGALTTQAMATSFPQNVRGMHLNMAAANNPSATFKLLLAQLVRSG